MRLSRLIVAALAGIGFLTILACGGRGKTPDNTTVTTTATPAEPAWQDEITKLIVGYLDGSGSADALYERFSSDMQNAVPKVMLLKIRDKMVPSGASVGSPQQQSSTEKGMSMLIPVTLPGRGDLMLLCALAVSGASPATISGLRFTNPPNPALVAGSKTVDSIRVSMEAFLKGDSDPGLLYARLTPNAKAQIPESDFVQMPESLKQSGLNFRRMQFKSTSRDTDGERIYYLVQFEVPDGSEIVLELVAAFDKFLTADEGFPTGEVLNGFLIGPSSGDTLRPMGAEDITSKLESASGRYSALAATIEADGSLKVIYAHNPELALAIGSAFKLMVLGSVCADIDAGQYQWTDEMTLTDNIKSLPSGELATATSGTKYSINDLANRMIYQSDNTATDILISKSGREKIESFVSTKIDASLARRNTPLITTRELFVMRLDESIRSKVGEFESGELPAKRAFLQTIASKPLPSINLASQWVEPREVKSAEWYMSASELAKILAMYATGKLCEGSSRELGLAALKINPGIPPESSPDIPAEQRYVVAGFKGGSEPGVLNFSQWIVMPNGKSIVIILTRNVPTALDEIMVNGINLFRSIRDYAVRTLVRGDAI